MTLEGPKSTPRGPKTDCKMPTIDSQRPTGDSQSAKPNRRPKSTPSGQKATSVVPKSTLTCLNLNPMKELKIDHPQRPKSILRGVSKLHSWVTKLNLYRLRINSQGQKSTSGSPQLTHGIKVNCHLLKIDSSRQKDDSHS